MGEDVKAVIVKADSVIHEMLETYMVENSISTVAGIFLLKNQFGYVDAKEVHQTTDDASAKRLSAEQVKDKYLGEMISTEKRIIGKKS
jgi:hypothetical protein